MTKRELRIIIMEEMLRAIDEKEANQINEETETEKLLSPDEVDSYLTEALNPQLISEATVANAMEDIIKPTLEYATKNAAALKGKNAVDIEKLFMSHMPVINNQMQNNLAAQIVAKTLAADNPNFENAVKWNEADGHGSTASKTIAPIANQMWKDFAPYIAKVAVAKANGDQVALQSSSKEIVSMFQKDQGLFQKAAGYFKKLAGVGAAQPATATAPTV